MHSSRLIGLAALLVAVPIIAQPSPTETHRQYLSGRGPDDAVPWQFRISSGRRAGEWTSIDVPSQWELQGFGTYNYGWEDDKSAEVGEYRVEFTAPAQHSARRSWLVFGGVMTDAEVRLNGELLGNPHQGGFTRFSYPVNDQIRPGEKNVLEVRVSEQSANRSVNRAERDADYWIFGGIYRPVYLESLPESAIRRAAVAADHRGQLTIEAELVGTGGTTMAVEIRDASADATLHRTAVPVAGARVELQEMIPGIRPWSAESPHLYELRLQLLDGDGEVLHHTLETIGFRSVEVRSGSGLHVNDHKVLLKGINRHSFWPDTGRSLTRAQNERDAQLIKEMNMNAVRTSHYPPDEAFLDACDRLGLYVLDELPGWHDAYDTKVGIGLVRELVERDHNHPSVIAWNNGNEGGWNTRLDAHFRENDLQERPVLHPDELAAGLDTEHYLDYEELKDKLYPGWARRLLPGPPPPVMPTEILHGLYDGGLGAGLRDYWDLVRSSPLGAGLFLWTFVDEGVVRTDEGGRIDTYYNLGPDGIVGPYREKEASFQTVRDIWAPVVFRVETLQHRAPPRVIVDNRFDMSNLSACTFEWEWLRFPTPGDVDDLTVLETGVVEGPDVEPGGTALLDLGDRPLRGRVDALRVRAFDPTGREVGDQMWPVRLPADFSGRTVERLPVIGVTSGKREGNRITLSSGPVEVEIDAETGQLVSLRNGSSTAPLTGGRVHAGGEEDVRVIDVAVWDERSAATALLRLDRTAQYIRWRLDDRGWLHLDYQYDSGADAELEGVFFHLERAEIEAIRFLAAGPHRVWRNRRDGAQLGVWTGTPDPDPPWETWNYPTLEGFYADPYWARIRLGSGALSLLIASDDEIFLSLLRPRFPEGDSIDDESLARYTAAPTPTLDLGIAHTIPAVGTKFKRFDELGPQGADRGRQGLRRVSVAFHFEPPPTPKDR